jgi:hypothetical protein
VKLTVNVRAVPAIGVHAAIVLVVDGTLVDVVVVLTMAVVDVVVAMELVVVLPITVEVVTKGQVQSS